MTDAPIPRRSASTPIAASIGLVSAALFLFRDYYEIAMEHMSEGLFTTEQVFGLFVAAALVVSSIATLIAFPERLQVDAEGLVSVRGVFGTVRRVRPKATIQTIMIRCRRVRSNNLNVIINDVWIDGSAGMKRLCRFSSEDRPRADALAARCAEVWGAKVVPWT
jgi:hypothetical protein